jgi:hypothetical protein
MEKITISLIKADVGGFPGHSAVRPELKKKAQEYFKRGEMVKQEHKKTKRDSFNTLKVQILREEKSNAGTIICSKYHSNIYLYCYNHRSSVLHHKSY